MNIQPKQQTVKAPAETFIGDAWYDVIVRGEEPSRIRVSVVHFAPGARNAWPALSRMIQAISGLLRAARHVPILPRVALPQHR